MRTRGTPATVVALVLALQCAAGEWVQVAVIDRGPDGPRPQGPAAKTAASTTPVPGLAGPPGPSEDGVITIRRTVGDSFSNKEGVVPAVGEDLAAQPRPAGSQDDVESAPGGGGEGLPLPELREAHQALLRHSAGPVSGKLDFLRRLKNRLLRHIAALAPVSALGLAGGRAGRSDSVAEGRGSKGVGFPSNEGTLMSLAFLVFAVFLVKVVMQLIYAVQNSQYNNAGVRVAQVQLPGSMMGTMMNMVPGMMPPMMAAMEGNMALRTRRRAPDAPDVDYTVEEVEEYAGAQDVDRMAARVAEAIHSARAKLDRLASTQASDPS